MPPVSHSDLMSESDSDGSSDIGNDDDEGDEGEDGRLFLLFQSMMNDPGDVDTPVVNIWYDLDMVTEINDPDLFFEEQAKIKRQVYKKLLVMAFLDDTIF